MHINKSQTEKACIVLFSSCTTRQGNTLAVPRDQSHDLLCTVLDKKIHRWPNLDTRAIESVGQDRTGQDFVILSPLQRTFSISITDWGRFPLTERKIQKKKEKREIKYYNSHHKWWFTGCMECAMWCRRCYMWETFPSWARQRKWPLIDAIMWKYWHAKNRFDLGNLSLIYIYLSQKRSLVC